ncbi:unnamed protein product [Prunus armeniaca]
MKRLKSFHSFEGYIDFWLKNDPIVVGTYNDLILCCGHNYYTIDYYICNPYTMQWVALPPTPTNPRGHVRVGFICDSPCYNYKEEKGHVIQHNAEYRCKVVRILPPVEAHYYDSYELHLEIFSTETGEWREAVNYNDRLRVIGLNPFSDDDGVEGNYSYIAVDERLSDSGYFCACGGCMRMCGVEDGSLIVLDLKEEENGKLCLSKRKWSDEMAEKRPHKCYSNRRSFPIVLPWWPTPVPRLPQQAEQRLHHGGGTSS